MSYKRGLFALSADPITNGHLNLIVRAATKCEQLLVVIATSDTKKALFTLEERGALAERAIQTAGLANVVVMTSGDTLGAIYLDNACDVLFRGIRGEKDRIEEAELCGTYYALWPFLQGHIKMLKADPEFRFLSSTMVRVCAARHLPLEGLVPLHVKQALEERVASQCKIGITGRIATGKTWLGERLVAKCLQRGIAADFISLDQMIRRAYNAQTSGGEALRNQIMALLGPETVNGSSVNTRTIAEKIFAPSFTAAQRADYEKLTLPYVQREYQRALHDPNGIPLRGLIIVEWSQFAEMDMTRWVNNNVIVVDAPTADRNAYIADRGIDPSMLMAKETAQWSVERVSKTIDTYISRDGCGRRWNFVNTRREDHTDQLLDGSILPHFPNFRY